MVTEFVEKDLGYEIIKHSQEKRKKKEHEEQKEKRNNTLLKILAIIIPSLIALASLIISFIRK